MFERVDAGVASSSPRRQAQPGHRTRAFSQHEVEQLGFLIGYNRQVLVERDFDRSFAQFPKCIGVGLEFFAISQAARQRPALVTDMLANPGQREADSSGGDRFFKQSFNFGPLLGTRRAFHRLLAHHHVAERRERRQKTQVKPAAAPRGGVHVFRKALPIPGDSLGEHVKGDAFDVDQVPGGDSRSASRHGAMPTPQLPITTLVTPCHDEQVISGSQHICAS